MRKLRVRKNIKISKVLIIVMTLVFFFTSIMFNAYSKIASPRITRIANIKIKEYMESFLSNNIGYDILNKSDLDNILIINKNEQKEILYVDYDLDKAYNVLDIVTTKLNTLINDLEHGKVSNVDSKNIVYGPDALALKIPLFSPSSNILIASLGPSIYVPVNFVGSILTNIKSKITNYGLNNALVELYITIKVTANLIMPLADDTVAIDYDVLVASTVINGRVPEVYGGLISKESSALSIPIE